MLKTEKSGMLNESKSQTPQSRWLRIERAIIYAGVSRTFLYGLLNRRSVASHIVGRVRLVDRESLDAFISAAPVGDFDCGTKQAKRKASVV